AGGLAQRADLCPVIEAPAERPFVELFVRKGEMFDGQVVAALVLVRGKDDAELSRSAGTSRERGKDAVGELQVEFFRAAVEQVQEGVHPRWPTELRFAPSTNPVAGAQAGP